MSEYKCNIGSVTRPIVWLDLPGEWILWKGFSFPSKAWGTVIYKNPPDYKYNLRYRGILRAGRFRELLQWICGSLAIHRDEPDFQGDRPRVLVHPSARHCRDTTLSKTSDKKIPPHLCFPPAPQTRRDVLYPDPSGPLLYLSPLPLAGSVRGRRSHPAR